MCGVIGFWPLTAQTPSQLFEQHAAMQRLLLQSRVRGMHAYGITQPVGEEYLCTRSFGLAEVAASFDPLRPAIAHARYSTSGDWRNVLNNQPIHIKGYALAFNGVIHMGTREEFNYAFDVECVTDNDGEVFLRLISEGKDPDRLVMDNPFSFAGVWFKGHEMFAIRNSRRPLWYCCQYGAMWVASTRDIFLRAGFDDASGYGNDMTELQPGQLWSFPK